MHTEKVDAQDLVGASALLGAGLSEQVSVTGRYDVKCLDADGSLKWEDSIDNLVVNVGKANLLGVYLGALTQTTQWYMGLVSKVGSFVPVYSSTDTLASHGDGVTTGWAESTAYSGSNRLAVTFGTATASGGGAGTAGTGTITNPSAVSFTINATTTIAGALLCQTQTRATTTGILYSAGSFATARDVISGDQLLVTYTAQS
jgi:hypothetical protein